MFCFHLQLQPCFPYTSLTWRMVKATEEKDRTLEAMATEDDGGAAMEDGGGAAIDHGGEASMRVNVSRRWRLTVVGRWWRTAIVHGGGGGDGIWRRGIDGTQKSVSEPVAIGDGVGRWRRIDAVAIWDGVGRWRQRGSKRGEAALRERSEEKPGRIQEPRIASNFREMFVGGIYQSIVGRSIFPHRFWRWRMALIQFSVGRSERRTRRTTKTSPVCDRPRLS